jgi:hypothetical protein
VRIRTLAYKKWLFLEAAPAIVFREEHDFDPTRRLSLALDAVFGERDR